MEDVAPATASDNWPGTIGSRVSLIELYMRLLVQIKLNEPECVFLGLLGT